MNLKLWQLFAIVTWVATAMAFAVAYQLPLAMRICVPCCLTAIVLTFGRPMFPRPARRLHIQNEEQLQKLADILIFGLPAFLLYFVSLTALFSSIIVGFLAAIATMLVYATYVLSSHQQVAND